MVIQNVYRYTTLPQESNILHWFFTYDKLIFAVRKCTCRMKYLVTKFSMWLVPECIFLLMHSEEPSCHLSSDIYITLRYIFILSCYNVT